MTEYSTRQAAQKLGISLVTLQRYIARKKVPAPAVTCIGAGKFRIWTAGDIETVRRVLPSLENGRKTRYVKQHMAIGNKQFAKSKTKKKQPQPRAAVPHKKG